MVELEKDYDVQIVTQNVDNLHEKAGSTNVLHLHGEIMKCRDCGNPKYIFDIPLDENGNYNTYPGMKITDDKGTEHPIRPHIVFFHEDVPNITKAIKLCKNADIFVCIGSSMQVYPAAGLIDYVNVGNPIYYIDPFPSINQVSYPDVQVIDEVATKGVKKLIEILCATK